MEVRHLPGGSANRELDGVDVRQNAPALAALFDEAATDGSAYTDDAQAIDQVVSYLGDKGGTAANFRFEGRVYEVSLWTT